MTTTSTRRCRLCDGTGTTAYHYGTFTCRKCKGTGRITVTRAPALVIAGRDLHVGDTVRRTSGKTNTGIIKVIYRTTAGTKRATVHWSNAVRRIGGKSDWHSDIKVDALVLVRPAVALPHRDEPTAA